MISSTSSTTSVLDTGGTPTTKTNAADDAASAQDRFLKLLVAQLNNQDPMNPMDNAQMTSQIAQINTVTGIQQLNETVKGLAGQFAAQQLMQGSAMVGRNVLVPDNTLTFDTETKSGGGAFDLAGSAAGVQVQVLDVNNKQVGTIDLGALKAGAVVDRVTPDGTALYAAVENGHADVVALLLQYGANPNIAVGSDGSCALVVAAAGGFEDMAANGDAPVDAVPLAVDQVTAVSMDNGALALQLSRGGTTSYSAIKAIL